MDLPPDFRELLAEFARSGVEAVNKRAVARPQDLIDAEFLERVRSSRAKST